MIILHFHLQPQFKNELFHIYFTSYCTHFVQLSVLVLIQLLERLLSGPEVLGCSVYSLHCNDQEMKTSSISLKSRYLRPKGFPNQGRRHQLTIGSLRCHYGDGNENVKKGLVKISKTTTLHIHRAFLYISLPSLHDYDVSCLISRFIDNVNIRRRITLTLFKLGYFS